MESINEIINELFELPELQALLLDYPSHLNVQADVFKNDEDVADELMNHEAGNQENVDLLQLVFDNFEFKSMFDNIVASIDEPMVTADINDNQQSGFGLSSSNKMDKVYTIKNVSTQHNNKFKYERKIYDLELDLNYERSYSEAVDDMKHLFEQLHTDFVQGVAKKDQVKLVFDHDMFKQPIWFPFLNPADITPDLIQHTFERIVQSYKLSTETLQSKNKFTAKVVIVHMPSGSGPMCSANNLSPFDQFLHNTPSIKVIYNKDTLCLLRAVIIALAFQNKDKAARTLHARPNSMEMKKRMHQLCQATKIFSGPCGIDDIKTIEEHLKDYQIMVVDGNCQFNEEPIYLDRQRNNKKHLYLCLHNQHYYVITSMKVFLRKVYFCPQCKVGYNQLGKHKCAITCTSCFRVDCFSCDVDMQSTCGYCKKRCFNDVCERIHRETFCSKVAFCSKCDKRKFKNHVCEDEKFCTNCKKAVPLDHKCYILTENERQAASKNRSIDKFNGYIFFDYEAYQDENGEHVPNLIIAKRICKDCLEHDTLCHDCQQLHIFHNNNEFCAWLLSNDHYTALAHNLKGYDGTFIANYCINNLTSADSFPEMIATPTKLLQIQFKKVKIIDSYSFMAMALDKFPTTFDIPEMKKGFYPHMFNRPENEDYIGDYPDKAMYGSDYFSVSKKAEFEAFYAAVKDKQFDNKTELRDYCISDVEILTAGCLKFRRIIMDQTKLNDQDVGVDPFRVAITIASLCNHIYRRNFMKPNTIAVIPDNGYNPNQNSSNKCRQWLRYLSERDSVFIQSADNLGEKRSGSYLLDGYCEQTKTVYEFHGCYWHGCMKCYSNTTWNSTKNFTMGYINRCHLERIVKLRKSMSECNFVEIWECEYDKECTSNIGLQTHVRLNPIHEPLKPRDSLFGGRTNAFKLHYACKGDEKIKYYDITSLYPAVQKQEQYPIGHPEIIINPDTTNIDNYFGLVKCSVLPPRRLYAPVLPARINKKLVFTLCAKCANDRDNICKHPERDRIITGTWTTVEVNKALEKGYLIKRIYEIWHWKEKGDLFSGYVNACMKEKQEASGFPHDCVTEEQKHQYIADYFEHEGIKLDYNNIKKNTGARQTAKMKANSQWGYMAMNTNKTKHKFVKTAAHLQQMLSDDQYIVHNIIPCNNDEVMQVYYTVNNQMHTGGVNTNVCVASFVTSYGRLRLYNEIDKLGDRVLYFDTDSIIFVSRPGQYEPKLGNFLGQFTNEIEPKDGEYIIEFVSAGPKNYAFKLNTGVTKCTVKGINLNHVASLTINYESIKHIVCGDHTSKLLVKQLKFKRDNKKWILSTSEDDKSYGFVYDKRILKKTDLTTLPYGY